MAIFFGKPKYQKVAPKTRKKEMPEGLWIKCEDCGEIIFGKTLEENLKVCPKCNYHFVLGAQERIRITLDEGSFKELDKDLITTDPLEFQGPKTYKEKLRLDI